jgi:type IV secretion system protein TrbI
MKLSFSKSFCLLVIISVFFTTNVFADVDNEAAKYHIQTGTIIQVKLLNGIDTSLTGTILAQVRQDIYDAATGKYLLIPSGSKLIGEYKSHNVTYGQYSKRSIAIWFTRIVCPNGASILLGKPVYADMQEQTAVEKNIDNNLRQIVDTATISTLFSVGTGVTSAWSDRSNIPSIKQNIGAGAAQAFSDVGEQSASKAMNMAPTITLLPGHKIAVYVKKNMVLTPYKAGN